MMSEWFDLLLTLFQHYQQYLYLHRLVSVAKLHVLFPFDFRRQQNKNYALEGSDQEVGGELNIGAEEKEASSATVGLLW